MTSRERVRKALNHDEPDRVPVDFGSSAVTGIHVTALDGLIKKLKLRPRTVKAYEPMMMLGLVDTDVIAALGGDIIGLHGPNTLLGYRNENWKNWKLPNGTDVLVGEGFTFTLDDDGSIFLYPQQDAGVPPSAKMPADGWYFDHIWRQDDLTNHNFNARKDYDDQYPIFSEEECRYYEEQAEKLYEETEYSVFGHWFGGGLGDFFHIPGPWLKRTPGIRDLNDWIMAAIDHPDYVNDFFELQTERALENLELYRQAVGERIDAIAVSGTDFGSQMGPFISPGAYREFYKPRHKRINDWIHKNTSWRVFFHSCGSVIDFFDDFIEAGVDIINPVQCTAAGMDARTLKETYGDKLVFNGGGIDTQKTLPFGTPEEVREETRRNVKILSQGGGYVCSTVHNIQGPTPVENIISFFKAVNG
jgi:hypothetical protein